MEFAHFGYVTYTQNKGPFIFCILSWKHAKNFLGQKMDDQLSHFKGGTAATMYIVPWYMLARSISCCVVSIRCYIGKLSEFQKRYFGHRKTQKRISLMWSWYF